MLAEAIDDGRRVIQERDGANNPQVSYTRGRHLSGSLEGAGGIGGLLARSAGYSAGRWTSHAYYHADGNGNVTFLLASNQTLAASYRYDPYGNRVAASGPLADANVYRFSSKEIHVNSGMYYYGYRFYDPNLQRWLNRDPLEEFGGLNLYWIADNEPLNLVDIDGLQLFPPILIEDPPVVPRPISVPPPRIPGVSYPKGGLFPPEGTVEHPARPGKFGIFRPTPKGTKFDECWRFDKGDPTKPGEGGIDHFHYWGTEEHLHPPLPPFEWFSVPPVNGPPLYAPLPPGVQVPPILVPLPPCPPWSVCA